MTWNHTLRPIVFVALCGDCRVFQMTKLHWGLRSPAPSEEFRELMRNMATHAERAITIWPGFKDWVETAKAFVDFVTRLEKER